MDGGSIPPISTIGHCRALWMSLPPPITRQTGRCALLHLGRLRPRTDLPCLERRPRHPRRSRAGFRDGAPPARGRTVGAGRGPRAVQHPDESHRCRSSAPLRRARGGPRRRRSLDPADHAGGPAHGSRRDVRVRAAGRRPRVPDLDRGAERRRRGAAAAVGELVCDQRAARRGRLRRRPRALARTLRLVRRGAMERAAGHGAGRSRVDRHRFPPPRRPRRVDDGQHLDLVVGHLAADLGAGERAQRTQRRIPARAQRRVALGARRPPRRCERAGADPQRSDRSRPPSGRTGSLPESGSPASRSRSPSRTAATRAPSPRSPTSVARSAGPMPPTPRRPSSSTTT